MKLKTFSLITLFSGLALLITGALLPIFYRQEFAIIGGAEAPEILPHYMFYASSMEGGLPLLLMVIGITLIITAVFCLIFPKTMVKNCLISTSLTSLSLSLFGALGIVCFFVWLPMAAFNEFSDAPIEHLVSVAVGVISFLAFIILIIVYFNLRKRNFSAKGFVIDILTSIIYLPAFICIFEYIRGFLDGVFL